MHAALLMNRAQMNAEANFMNQGLATLTGARQAAPKVVCQCLWLLAAFFMSGGTDNGEEGSNLSGGAEGLGSVSPQKGCS